MVIDLPGVITRVYSGGTPSEDGSATRDGASPFAPVVFPGLVSPKMSSPADKDGVADEDGLSSAFYESTTSFQIESRDRCSYSFVSDTCSEGLINESGPADDLS